MRIVFQKGSVNFTRSQHDSFIRDVIVCNLGIIGFYGRQEQIEFVEIDEPGVAVFESCELSRMNKRFDKMSCNDGIGIGCVHLR